MCTLHRWIQRFSKQGGYVAHNVTSPHFQGAQAWYHVIVEHAPTGQSARLEAVAHGGKEENRAFAIADHSSILPLGGHAWLIAPNISLVTYGLLSPSTVGATELDALLESLSWSLLMWCQESLPGAAFVSMLTVAQSR